MAEPCVLPKTWQINPPLSFSKWNVLNWPQHKMAFGTLTHAWCGAAWHFGTLQVGNQMNCGFWLFGCSLSAAVGALPQLRACSCVKEEISLGFCEVSVYVCMWRSEDKSQGSFLSFHLCSCDPAQAGRLGDRRLYPHSHFISLEIGCKTAL